MGKYNFIPHITITTQPYAEKLASKYGLTLSSAGTLAIYFMVGANERNGRGEQFIDEVIMMDMQSESFAEFNKQLSEQEDFKSLMDAIVKIVEVGVQQGKKRSRKKKKKTKH